MNDNLWDPYSDAFRERRYQFYYKIFAAIIIANIYISRQIKLSLRSLLCSKRMRIIHHDFLIIVSCRSHSYSNDLKRIITSIIAIRWSWWPYFLRNLILSKSDISEVEKYRFLIWQLNKHVMICRSQCLKENEKRKLNLLILKSYVRLNTRMFQYGSMTTIVIGKSWITRKSNLGDTGTTTVSRRSCSKRSVTCSPRSRPWVIWIQIRRWRVFLQIQSSERNVRDKEDEIPDT